jgi:endonuclease/exonuclease/phosphatase family metal-dependent hydrolase
VPILKLFIGFLMLSYGMVSIAHLELSTWNVAEISDPNLSRIERLLDAALSDQPDVVLLQEVETLTWRALHKHPQVINRYRIAYEPSRSGPPRGGIATLFRSDLKVESTRYENLPSEMGRGVLILPVRICSETVQVVNVHLESPDLLFWRSLSYRHQQVDHIHRLSDQHSHWIVAGDFNPVFESDPAHLFPATWLDAWVDQHPKEEGLTWDPERNKMAYRSGGFLLSGYRLDRVLLRSDAIGVKSITRLGVDTIDPLSDHYGLHAALVCRRHESQPADQ